MATKKKPAKRTSKASTKKTSSAMRSFRVEPETIPFNTFRITRQTVYWVVLLLVIIATQLWILKLQMEIANLTELLMATQ